MNEYTLYRMFNANRELLYVGLTMRPLNRLRSHEKTKQWWSEVDTIQLEHFTSLEQLQQAERIAIRSEKPRYNVMLRGLPRMKTYSLEQVADCIGLPGTPLNQSRWLIKQIKNGRLPATKSPTSRKWRISEAGLLEFFDRCSNKPTGLSGLELLHLERERIVAAAAARRRAS